MDAWDNGSEVGTVGRDNSKHSGGPSRMGRRSQRGVFKDGCNGESNFFKYKSKIPRKAAMGGGMNRGIKTANGHSGEVTSDHKH